MVSMTVRNVILTIVVLLTVLMIVAYILWNTGDSNEPIGSLLLR